MSQFFVLQSCKYFHIWKKVLPKVIEEGVAEWISSGVKRLREYKGRKINKPEKNNSILITFNS